MRKVNPDTGVARFKIRLCRSGDFAALLRLLRQLWPEKRLHSTALRKVFKRALASDSQVYLCAAAGENIAGFASLTVKNNLWQAANLGHIDELVVDEKYRGRGLGTQLLEEIIERARQRGCVRVELDSAFRRKEAHRFYEEHSFENRAYLFSKEI